MADIAGSIAAPIAAPIAAVSAPLILWAQHALAWLATPAATHLGYAIAGFIAVVCAIVFVHEYGHYRAARWAGVQVEVFAIGFGPELFGYTTRDGVRWKCCLFPMGGYVRMLGDADAASARAQDVAPHLQSRSFPHASLGRKAWITVAGPLANIAFTLVLMVGFTAYFGKAEVPSMVAATLPDSPAAHAGIQPGDTITQVNATPVTTFAALREAVGVASTTGEPLHLTLTNPSGTRVVTLTLPCAPRKEGQTKPCTIGVAAGAPIFHPVPPARWVPVACHQTWRMASDMLSAIAGMVAGTRSTEELGGPLRIAVYSGESLVQGTRTFVWFLALLSLNLGIINLLPIPVLDGGHLAMYALQAVRGGKPLSPRVQDYLVRLGMAALMVLAVYTTWNDIRQLWHR